MNKRIRRQLYNKYVNGSSLQEMSDWLDKQGYRKRKVKERPATVLNFPCEITFPMSF